MYIYIGSTVFTVSFLLSVFGSYGKENSYSLYIFWNRIEVLCPRIGVRVKVCILESD